MRNTVDASYYDIRERITLLGFAVILLIMGCALTFWGYLMIGQKLPKQAAHQIATITVTVTATPTVTTTKTPIPSSTISPVPSNTSTEKVVIIERIITPTEEPSTQTPWPTRTGTATPDYDAEYEVLELSEAKRDNRWANFWQFVAFVLIGSLILIACRWQVIKAYRYTAKKLTRSKTPHTITRKQPTNAVSQIPQPIDKTTNSRVPADETLEILELYLAGKYQYEIEDAIYEHWGGSAARRVKYVLDHYYPNRKEESPTSSLPEESAPTRRDCRR